MPRSLFLLLPCVLVAALLVATFLQVKEVAAACGIAWDNFQPTCDTIDAQRTFSYSLDTSWTSINQEDWTLITSFTPGNSENIEDGNVTPGSHDIVIEDTEVLEADVASTVNSGRLKDNEPEGTFQMSAHDNTHFNCHGSHDVTIFEDEEECP